MGKLGRWAPLLFFIPFVAIVLAVAIVNLWYSCDVLGNANDCQLWMLGQWVLRGLAAAAIWVGIFLAATQIQEAVAFPDRTPIYIAFGGVAVAAMCAILLNISIFVIAGVVLLFGLLIQVFSPHMLFRDAFRAIGLHRYLARILGRSLGGRTPALVETFEYGHVATKGRTFEFDSQHKDSPPASDWPPVLEVRQPAELVQRLAAGDIAESIQVTGQIALVGSLVYLVLNLELPNGDKYAIPICVGQRKGSGPLDSPSTYLHVEHAVSHEFLSVLKEAKQVGIGAYTSPDLMKGVMVNLPQPIDFAPYAITPPDKDVQANPQLARGYIKDHVITYLTTGQFQVTPGWWERQVERRKLDSKGK